MRTAAAVLLTAASVCMGFWLRDSLHRRVQVWTQVCLFFREVRLRAKLHEPLDAQIAALAKESGLEKLTFLPDCNARIRQGQPLPQAWTGAVDAFARAHRLPHDQKDMLAQCVPTLSAANSQRVDGLLELYETRSAQALGSAVQTDASVGGLCVRVCGAAGLLLGILIL